MRGYPATQNQEEDLCECRPRGTAEFRLNPQALKLELFGFWKEGDPLTSGARGESLSRETLWWVRKPGQWSQRGHSAHLPFTPMGKELCPEWGHIW